MLKIKESVDLKELERFGFKKDANLSDEYETIYSKKEEYQTLCVEKSSRIIALNEPYNSNTFVLHCNVLYDLIQADLVEKV